MSRSGRSGKRQRNRQDTGARYGVRASHEKAKAKTKEKTMAKVKAMDTTKSMISDNQKTVRSADLTTICERGCAYCYVKTARDNNFNAKARYSCRYAGDVLHMQQRTIDKLNSAGGLRLFSFGDYQKWMNEDLEQFFADCESVGLTVKAITKNPAFVRRFHNQKALRVCHLSIDRVGSGVNHRTARRYRAKYGKVLVRAVALSSDDVEWFGSRSWIDILTLNHGANGFEQFKGKKRKAIEKRFPSRVCCSTGECLSCPVKCGEPARK